jgi:SPP1 family predicted phage head-tail adaptor
MAAGPLRERIEIQAKTLTSDGMGGFTETWAIVATVWGRTWGATGNERQLATMSQAQVSRHFAVRYFADLTTQHRVIFEGQSYNVTFVNHIKQDGMTYFDGTELTGREAN